MAVKTYSLRTDGNEKLSENFKAREFRSRDGADEILIDEKLVTLLQKMRDKFGLINISSAYRTKTYNKKVGGVSNSLHLYGKAADITIRDNSRLTEAAQYAEKIGFSGIGLDNKYQMYIHLDTRSGKSYFRYNSNGSTYSVGSFFPTVRNGSRGNDVRTLQTKLKKLGFTGKNSEELTVDGIFGGNTEYAIISFQKSKGLSADGIAGPKTWAKL
ncbi:MAG: peptidoglycan-binding protein [Clostridia bacterium]|nr:peptidoglycan-binding protein [Clostridia bacterium]